jgi:hemerythrin superfamily protein
MVSKIENGQDVVSFLKAQHQQIKAMFEGVLNASGEQRRDAFFDIRRTMAVHEAAEEEIVHPSARRALPNGDAIVEARLREENAAKTALALLEKLDVDSPEFEAQFRTLKMKVLAHAQSEEKEEFEKLPNVFQQEQLERMAKAVQIAEAIAPTRPHPAVGETAAANFLAGPFASMIDRARDAFVQKH